MPPTTAAVNSISAISSTSSHTSLPDLKTPPSFHSSQTNSNLDGPCLSSLPGSPPSSLSLSSSSPPSSTPSNTTLSFTAEPPSTSQTTSFTTGITTSKTNSVTTFQTAHHHISNLTTNSSKFGIRNPVQINDVSSQIYPPSTSPPPTPPKSRNSSKASFSISPAKESTSPDTYAVRQPAGIYKAPSSEHYLRQRLPMEKSQMRTDDIALNLLTGGAQGPSETRKRPTDMMDCYEWPTDMMYLLRSAKKLVDDEHPRVYPDFTCSMLLWFARKRNEKEHHLSDGPFVDVYQYAIRPYPKSSLMLFVSKLFPPQSHLKLIEKLPRLKKILFNASIRVDVGKENLQTKIFDRGRINIRRYSSLYYNFRI